MSSHHSQECFNLHHSQVNAGKARRLQHQAERLHSFLTVRKQLRLEYNCVLVFSFICFAYTMLATSVYLGYIIYGHSAFLVR